jgi:diguanylate cyclase
LIADLHVVNESADWKQKYRDLLLELESEERRSRHVEKVLRHLVSRLCAAGMGVHARLDDELTALAAANRRNADIGELEALAASLTSAVTAVDEVAPVLSVPAMPLPARPIRWNATCAATGVIIDRLAFREPDDADVRAMRAELAQAGSDAQLAKVLVRAADLIRKHREMIADQRSQATAVLAEVSRRLDELAEYFVQSARADRSGYDDAESLNRHVTSQVRELTEEARAATDLRVLQSLVSAGMESVSHGVREFRGRAEERLLEQTTRTDTMRVRVAVLERETHALHEQLDDERSRARIDPVTEVANRKAFDERIAQEITRKADTESAVTLLLWDIDDFKSINDSYGHRAGDRVLRSVARCLAGGLRPTDFVARIGGEEFAVILNDLPIEAAMAVADELRSSVAGLRFHFRGAPVHVTACCGAAALGDLDTAESAFDRADAALYRAKSAGKNRCVSGEADKMRPI